MTNPGEHDLPDHLATVSAEDLPRLETWEAFPDLAERPRLLLGVKPDPGGVRWRFRAGRTWQHLTHRAGGLASNRQGLLATELTVRPEREAGLLRLARRYTGSAVGCFGTTVNDLVRYRAALQELLGVDANADYEDFQEALYPVDVTPEHLTTLTDEALPEHLDDLLMFDTRWDRAIGGLNRWKLWIITENAR